MYKYHSVYLKKICAIYLKMKHIMISYQWDDQPFCIKMKHSLEKAGYNVWMDIDKMHGSTLDSMAEAVEQSFCVIMCITLKYKNSKSCKQEIEYADKLNKPLIPLMLQKGYIPDSWLGLILGKKIYIDAKIYNYKTTIDKLINEIECIKVFEKVMDSHVKYQKGKIEKNNDMFDSMREAISNKIKALFSLKSKTESIKN
jgi:hypothetical protein